MKIKKTYKRIFIVIVLVYLIYIFVSQQKTLDSYKKSQAYYNGQIKDKIAYQEALNDKKSNINSEEYIEQLAREKLDMYLPNEKVYIDISK